MRTHEAARPAGETPMAPLGGLRALASSAIRAVWGVAEGVLGWHDRWRQRQALMTLDEHMLKDIGISRTEADQEGAKPFWKE